jgi:hypothetical protein
MSLSRDYPIRARTLRLFMAAGFVLILSAMSSVAADPILNLYVEDIPLTPDDSLVSFEVTMNATEDLVESFEIWLQMCCPFILRFDMDDPVDTTGSVMESWQLSWTDLGSQGGLIKILGWQGSPGTPISPSDVSQLLFTLNAEVVDPMADTLCGFTGDVFINVWTYFNKSAFPYRIGWDYWEEYDTTFENCVEWDGDSCIAWADTIVDTIPYLEPNMELLNYQDGSYTFICFLCGDCDGSGEVDIDDVVYLITYIFASGPPPDPLEKGDADWSGAVDIDDVVYLIYYIFAGGPPPCD